MFAIHSGVLHDQSVFQLNATSWTMSLDSLCPISVVGDETLVGRGGAADGQPSR